MIAAYRRAFLSIAILLFLCGVAGATSTQWLEDGVSVHFRSSLEGGEMTDGAGTAAARLFYDRKNHILFGYWLGVERLPGDRLVRLRFSPLPKDVEERLRRTWDASCTDCPAPLALTAQPSQYPDPQVIPVDTDFRVDLLENPKTGEKVFDIISVSVVSAAARVAGALELRNATLFVDDKPLANKASCAGEIVYFYVPGKGRFLLSRRPRVGFVQGARLQLHVIEMSLNGVRYGWMSDDAIAKARTSQSRAAETVPEMILAMRHEPNWKPAEPLTLAANGYGAGVASSSEFPPAEGKQALPVASGFSIDLKILPLPDGTYVCDALITDPATGEILNTPSFIRMKARSTSRSKLTISMRDGKVAEVDLTLSTDSEGQFATYAAKVTQGGIVTQTERLVFPLKTL
jgi:hypothetical protein